MPTLKRSRMEPVGVRFAAGDGDRSWRGELRALSKAPCAASGMTSTVGRYAAAVRVEAPSVTTRDRREHYPPIGLDPCIVNGRLRHSNPFLTSEKLRPLAGHGADPFPPVDIA